MLKRQGVKRAHRVAQIVRSANEAADYRAHVHEDIPDSAQPLNLLAKLGSMLADAYRFVRAFLGFGSIPGIPVFRVKQHAELRALFPDIKGDFAFPTPPQPGALFGREAYRASRRRFRERWQHRARYRKVRMPVGFGLEPATLENIEFTDAEVASFRDAAVRAGLL